MGTVIDNRYHQYIRFVNTFANKVITTMVIRPLDDHTCAQSVVANLQPLGLGYVGIGMSSFGSPPMYSY